MWSDDGEREIDYHGMMRMIQEVQEQELPKIKEEGYTFYGIKCIYATLRKEETDEMVWGMDMAIQLKQAFPDLICGFDMAGQEDAGHTLSYFVPELLEMRRKCDELGLDLPFIFQYVSAQTPFYLQYPSTLVQLSRNILTHAIADSRVI